tara:strand:+ start:52078 stop:52263 length:186 start_codon:yes stop_codon:yes gene_type:complete
MELTTFNSTFAIIFMNESLSDKPGVMICETRSVLDAEVERMTALKHIEILNVVDAAVKLDD